MQGRAGSGDPSEDGTVTGEKRRESLVAVAAAMLTTWALWLFGVEPTAAGGLGLSLGAMLKGN